MTDDEAPRLRCLTLRGATGGIGYVSGASGPRYSDTPGQCCRNAGGCGRVSARYFSSFVAARPGAPLPRVRHGHSVPTCDDRVAVGL